MPDRYDVVVIGAGHAGCEAARACARMGLRTAMVTMNLDLIAQMSCNPAIGGIAKGHLVREIDALGGVMGEVADAVGIQFRLLNTSRGPAVWSPRAQMDKKLYRHRMKEVLEAEPNLRIKQAEVAAIRLDEGRQVTGVILRDGRTVDTSAVIVTTGTFLNGLAHVGETTYSCGRNGEANSQLLGDQLRILRVLQRGVERAAVLAPVGTEDHENRAFGGARLRQGLLHIGPRVGGLVVRQRGSEHPAGQAQDRG